MGLTHLTKNKIDQFTETLEGRLSRSLMQSERLPPEVKIATSTCEIRNSTYTQAVRHAFLRCTLVRPPIRSHHHKFLARRPPACRFRAPGGSRSQAQLLTHRTQHRPKLSPMQSDRLTPEMQSMTLNCAIRELGTDDPHAGDQHADHQTGRIPVLGPGRVPELGSSRPCL